MRFSESSLVIQERDFKDGYVWQYNVQIDWFILDLISVQKVMDSDLGPQIQSSWHIFV